jgi:hypothetical protein
MTKHRIKAVANFIVNPFVEKKICKDILTLKSG